MVLLQDYIYFGNYAVPTIYIYNKTSLSRISSYGVGYGGGVTDMAMYAADAQPPAFSKLVNVVREQWRNQDFVSGVAVSVYGRTFRISRQCHCTESLSHWPTTKRTVKLKIAQFLESYFVL